ncbi:sugar transferase [Priestia megaterium]|uniref:sugar transferase n=1 Tax=Priestia megaterium TaxID=1404 RepID=UPI0023DA0FC3|nr:sugar transferase [Priestia megaterium]MDF2057774.1 sugar transferase [Priestia megaterium]MDF2063988.1 sugar transferase [Priestia megaterium]
MREDVDKVKNAISVNNNMSYEIIKRMIDIIGASIGIVFLSIIFLIVSIVIKIEDPKGPIFFSQVRVGKNGKKFKMYKFRSMVTDAEEKLEQLLQYNETTGAMFKMKHDPRVTKIGRFVRKTSIDELPQLLNVLKGEMSLVGPRPPLPREVDLYTKYDKQRLLVTPGCTGLWQISGRSNIGFKQMVELDLFYIEHKSLLLDMKIILKTCFLFLGSKGAF